MNDPRRRLSLSLRSGGRGSNARRILIAFAIGTTLAACSPSTPSAPKGPLSGATGTTNAHGLPELRNPLDGGATAIAAGAELYATRACLGCHGRELTGGMCPSLVNDVWVYGGDDTTLFHLVRDGSVALRAHGYARAGHEPQTGDMPPFGGALDDTQIWQLIAYIRSRHATRD